MCHKMLFEIPHLLGYRNIPSHPTDHTAFWLIANRHAIQRLPTPQY